MRVSVTFTISPKAPWTAGQTVTLRAHVRQDTIVREGLPVSFWARLGTFSTVIAREFTDINGVAEVPFTIPWLLDTTRVPCNTWNFWARSLEVDSAIVPGAIAYPTRVSIVAPPSVAADESFEISGKLEYESESGVWSPLAGRTVSLYYNTTHITDVTTGTDGSYSASASIPASGTYTLKASYAGEGFGFAPAFAVLGFPVGVPPELAPVAQYATYALAAVPILAVVGAIGCNELMKKRW